MNDFQQKAKYERVFKVPGKLTLVSVGKPIAVAGFNYGEFKRNRVKDDAAKYQIEAYAEASVPDMLRGATESMSLTPSAMADSTLVIAQNSIRIFNYGFAEAPYGRIAITQQSQFSFEQSWPTLVYLPISAFLDETPRWRLMGEHAFRFAHFHPAGHAARNRAWMGIRLNCEKNRGVTTVIISSCGCRSTWKSTPAWCASAPPASAAIRPNDPLSLGEIVRTLPPLP